MASGLQNSLHWLLEGTVLGRNRTSQVGGRALLLGSNRTWLKLVAGTVLGRNMTWLMLVARHCYLAATGLGSSWWQAQYLAGTWLGSCWWQAQYSVGERLHSWVQVRSLFCFRKNFSCILQFLKFTTFHNKSIIRFFPVNLSISFRVSQSKNQCQNQGQNQGQNQCTINYVKIITMSKPMHNQHIKIISQTQTRPLQSHPQT